MKDMLNTPAQRRAALAAADANSRIEALRRDPAFDPIFNAWVEGNMTDEEAVAAIKTQPLSDAHDKRVAAAV